MDLVKRAIIVLVVPLIFTKKNVQLAITVHLVFQTKHHALLAPTTLIKFKVNAKIVLLVTIALMQEWLCL